MRLISLIILLFLLVGCASKEPTIIYKTDYKEVKIPVTYKLERPKRPMFTSTDTVPVYLLKVLSYTKSLEVIIDEHNK